MSSDKYIIYVYKIVTKEDKLKLFIGSTKKKLPNLLQYFIGNCNSNKTSTLFEWLRPLNKTTLQIKLIKSYPVSNKEEKRKRERYWIRKYTDYGYTVIHNTVKNIEEVKTDTRIHLCLQNVSMAEIIGHFGDKIVSISKEIISKPVKVKHVEVKPVQIKPVKSKPLKCSGSGGYMDELANVLNRRNNSGLSISKIMNKKTPNIPKKLKTNNTEGTYDNILDELKLKIKKIE